MASTRSPLREFLARESSSGLLLGIAALVGILLANSPVSSTYFDVLSQGFSVEWGFFTLSLTVLKVINYGLMTIFFFVVGLEIKRELVSGHLASVKRAATPFLAALGGMVAPALIYLAISGSEAPSGWAVPVATDIALAVGLVSLMGTRATLPLNTFLLAIAVIDDIGAILIIAFIYSDGIRYAWIGGGFLAIALALLLRMRNVERVILYLLCGAMLWYCLYRSGVHPTLAGVIMGLLTPAKRQKLEASGESPTWIEWLERKVHPFSSLLVIPLFALANAGVSLSASNLSVALDSKVAWGIFLGLVAGKPLGIALFSILGSRLRIAELPEGAKPRSFLATASAAGIGFTVAIFLARLAFTEPALQEIAITAVVAGSIGSGMFSALLFRLRK